MKNIGVRYGLLGGAAVIFYFLLLYMVRKDLFLSPWLQWASLLIYLGCMYRATKEDGVLHGYQRDFRMMVRAPFVVFLLINIAYWLFYYALHLTDPELLRMETALDLTFKKQQLTAGLGDPQEANQLREQILALEKQAIQPLVQPLGPILFRLAIGSIGGFLLAAGVTALVRSGVAEENR